MSATGRPPGRRAHEGPGGQREGGRRQDAGACNLSAAVGADLDVEEPNDSCTSGTGRPPSSRRGGRYYPWIWRDATCAGSAQGLRFNALARLLQRIKAYEELARKESTPCWEGCLSMRWRTSARPLGASSVTDRPAGRSGRCGRGCRTFFGASPLDPFQYAVQDVFEDFGGSVMF